MELGKIPIGNFSLSDLRIMIGQQFGLPFLIPLALEKLKINLFIEADFYEGDLLSSVLNVETIFWNGNENYWNELNELIKNKSQKLNSLKILTTKFENYKFK